MTIREELSSLREALWQQVPSPKAGSFNDSFLYSIWKKQRAVAIGSGIYTTNRQVFCIELEDALSHECGCIPFGCKVKKSIHPIPNLIGGDNNLRVMTLDNKVIGYMETNELASSSLDPILAGRRRWSFSGRHIIIWNDKHLKVLQVYGPWEDPAEWIGLDYCGEDSTVGECAELDTIDAGLTEKQSALVLQLCLNILIPSLQIGANAQSDIHIEK